MDTSRFALGMVLFLGLNYLVYSCNCGQNARRSSTRREFQFKLARQCVFLNCLNSVTHFLIVASLCFVIGFFVVRLLTVPRFLRLTFLHVDFWAKMMQYAWKSFIHFIC